MSERVCGMRGWGCGVGGGLRSEWGGCGMRGWGCGVGGAVEWVGGL